MSNIDRERFFDRENQDAGASERSEDMPAAPVLRGTQALERLRERVELAARELERLRRDNRLLARRIAELEARPNVEEDQALIVLDDNADVLRKKVEGFIQAIDAHLARERARESEP